MSASRRTSFSLRSLASLAGGMAILASTAVATPPTVLLQDFEAGDGGAVAVNATNSPAGQASNSTVSRSVDSGSNVLTITDADGGTNGAVINVPNGIPGPGYYLFTAQVKVDNASSPINTYGMGVSVGGPSTTKISDVNAGYDMNLSGSGDAALGYQTLGAAVNVPSGGTFPQDVAIYFSTNVSGNDYNAPASDGSFANAHRSNGTAWAAGSSDSIRIDNIKRIGPGSFGEDRHLWISVGDGFTNLSALESMLVQAKANNFTSVDILARYRADALYVPNRTDATYPNPEPYSNKVGTLAASATNDPLQYAIDRGHELGLKVFISFSSFLVTPNATYPGTLPSDSIMYFYNNGAPRPMTLADNPEGLWADPGRADVRAYTKNIAMDIITNYDVDGIMFDRTRYPGVNYSYNPESLAELGVTGLPTPTSSSFRETRRQVITNFLGDCYDSITMKKPWMIVGTTPLANLDGMNDSYNFVMQSWPQWTARKTANRAVSFGCMDLIQPQFYRTASTAAPYTSPESNTRLMNKAQFGDLVANALDFGVMPGAYTNIAPLFYHPTTGDTANANANAQNITDSRSLSMNGFGLFAAKTSLADIGLIRAPGASSAGTDVLAAPAPKLDYLFKAGYDNTPPLAVTNFAAVPRTRGSVMLTWDAPAAASDGDTASNYLIYRSTSLPVKEYYANLVNKTPIDDGSTFFYAPVGEAGNYYYRIVSVDDYNNHGPAVEVGPIEVSGVTAPPAEVIVDNTSAAVTGAWVTGTSSADKYGINYYDRGVGTGLNKIEFSAALPATGNWTVSEWHPQGSNRATNARHIIVSDSGTDIKLVNQVTGGGKWNPVGTYHFTAGNEASVTIDDIFTGSVVMADAIKWTFSPTPVVVPSAPTGLSAQVTGSNQINLTWTDNATNETGYELVRTISGGTALVIDLPADTTSFSDTSLASDTEYHYVVRAYTIESQSPDSNLVTARTLPEIPADIIIDNSAASFTGTWATGTSAGKYGADYRSVSKGSGLRTAKFPFATERSGVYDVYEWHVAGSNRAGDAPHIIASLSGSTMVSVNQQINGAKWNKIGTYQFTGGTPYSVTLTDQFTIGTTEMADAIKVVYVSEPPVTPAAPSSLGATVISDTEISLEWADNAVNETGYEITRTKSGETPQIIASLPANAVSYADSGLTALTNYTYSVRAINAAGNSPSVEVTAETLSSTPADQIIDNADADLVGNWAVSTSSADKFGVSYDFKSKSANGAGKAIFNFTTRDTGMYDIYEWHPAGGNRPSDARHTISHKIGDSTVLVNQQINGGQWNKLGTWGFAAQTGYSVTIDDLFVNGTVVMADAIKVVYAGDLVAAPGAPTNLTATASGGSGIDLTWTDNSDSETGFTIFRNGVPVSTVGPDTTHYSDSGLLECTAYEYDVVAINDGGVSGESNHVTVTLDDTVPTITAPADVHVNTDAGVATASGVALGSPTTSDNCTGEVTTTNDAPAVFALGDTTVTWKAVDAHGNHAEATQKVTVVDAELPVVGTADAVSDIADPSDCQKAITLTPPTATDNVAVVSLTNDAPARFPTGATTVTWTATDAAGNQGHSSLVVTVAPNPAHAPAQVSATADSWDKITVTWADSSNETGYAVKIATDPAGPYTIKQNLAADVVSCQITDLLPNTCYYVVVEASNACGANASDLAHVSTPLFTTEVDPATASSNWLNTADTSAKGGSYLGRNRQSTDDPAVWNFSVPVAATYKVEVWIPNAVKLDTQAYYQIETPSGTVATTINQRKTTGTWVTLGTVELGAGDNSASVCMDNNSTNPVAADSIKLTQVAEPANCN